MPSYQEIDTRLAVLEDMLRFTMQSFQMKGVMSSGLSGPDGRPIGKPVEGSLLDLYLLHKTNSLAVASAPVSEPADAPALVTAGG